jgi:hypothetical protein
MAANLFISLLLDPAHMATGCSESRSDPNPNDFKDRLPVTTDARRQDGARRAVRYVIAAMLRSSRQNETTGQKPDPSKAAVVVEIR